nr:hypothetical protein [Candidatus Njordarchaeum guaymaensis]
MAYPLAITDKTPGCPPGPPYLPLPPTGGWPESTFGIEGILTVTGYSDKTQPSVVLFESISLQP